MKKTRAFSLLLSAGALASCAEAPPASMTLGAPRDVRAALAFFEDLGAEAQLVPQGADPLEAVALARGDDGVSFSGFVPAQPGTYTLEIAFSGARVGSGERRFLGRLVSDSFTVATAQAAEPAFTRPVDKIGRPEDGGDEDGDGLGFLDEVFFGADPARADSDEDGVVDGSDCDPTDAARAFAVADGGDLFDCDGDGFRRPDAPVGQSGLDCNDRDSGVNPGIAEDDCSDAVNADCNAETCPLDDFDGPSIVDVGAAGGGPVGCGGAIRARIDDASGVTSATLVFVDDPLGTFERAMLMRDLGGGVWEASPLNQAAGTGFRPGVHTVEVRAFDENGNRGTAQGTVDLFVTPPSVGVTGPQLIDVESPTTIDVSVSGPRPLSRVQLYAAPVTGFTLSSQHTLLADLPLAGGSYTIDPRTLPGTDRVVVFPLVEDDVGNVLAPYPGTAPNNTYTLYADFQCDGQQHYVPYVERPGLPDPGQQVKMGDLLQEAVAKATAVVPDAQLVQVNGFGVRADGTVDLSATNNYLWRWMFGFKQPGQDRWVTVTWLTEAYNTPNPTVDQNAGNVSSTEPLVDPFTLADSNAVVEAFQATAACDPVGGTDDDMIIYTVVDGASVAMVYNGAGESWRADAVSLVSDYSSCQ